METGSYDVWIGRDAYDRNGNKIGEVEDIHYDDLTSRPEWVAVRTGLFGKKVTFSCELWVPTPGARISSWPTTRIWSRTPRTVRPTAT